MNKTIICRHKGVQLTFNCEKIEKNVYKILRILNDAEFLYLFHSREAKVNEDETQNEKNTMRNFTYQLNTTEAIQLIWKTASIVSKKGLALQHQRVLVTNEYVGQNNILQQNIIKIEQKINKLSIKAQNQEKMDALGQLLSETKMQYDKIEKIWKTIRKSKAYQKLKQQLNQKNHLGQSNSILQEEQKRIIVDYIKRNLIKLDQRLFTSSIMYIYEKEDNYCFVAFQQCYPYIKCLKVYLHQLIGKQAYQKGLNRFYQAKKILKENSINHLSNSFTICHKCDQFDLHPNLQKQKDLVFQCSLKPNILTITSNPYTYQQVLLNSNFVNYCENRSEHNPDIQYNSFDKYIHPFLRTYKEKCSRYLCQKCFGRQKKTFEKNHIDNVDFHCEKQANIEQQDNNSKEKQTFQPIQSKYCYFCECTCTCYRCNTLDSFNKLMAIYDSLGGSFEEITQNFVFFNHKNDKLQIILHSDQLQKSDQQEAVRCQVPIKRKRGRPKKIQLQDKIEQKKRQKKQGKQRAPRKPREVKIKPPEIKFEYEEPDQDEMNENQDNNIQQNDQGEVDEIDSYQIFPELQNLFTSLLQEENRTFDYDDEGVAEKYGLEDESKSVKIEQVLPEHSQINQTIHHPICSPFDEQGDTAKAHSSESSQNEEKGQS